MTYKTLSYLPSADRYVSDLFIFTEDELDTLASEEIAWKKSQRTLSPYDLVDIYPEAKDLIKQNLEAEIATCKDNIKRAADIHNMRGGMTLRVPYKHQWLMHMIMDVLYIEPLGAESEKKMKRASFALAFLNGKSDSAEMRFTEMELSMAREVPLETLYGRELRSRHGTLIGPCPFHNEKTGSFTIYTNDNHFYCYGCSAGGGPIDYVMKRDSCGFVDAVKKLIMR